MATTEAAHRRILTDLRNPEQQAIVAAPLDGNHLVLAGPGSGKTRVIVHRVAWLLRECMVLPEEVMVLAYNRSAAVEVKRRLWELIGPDAAGVSVQTLHGLALRLTGTSYAVAADRGEAIQFDSVIKAATEMLKQAEQGDDVGPSIQRDRLLAGLRHLLVDEYQDVNADHFALISAMAGRTISSEEDRLSLLVVGDDDQNIYAFGGANVRFIRQFESDYQAKRFHLVENYRSSKHIIDCANQLIAGARERMKTDQVLRINHARRDQPAGGEFAERDPVAQGRVHVLEVPRDNVEEVALALAELERLNLLLPEGGGYWGRFAVIARHWERLEPLAALCRQQGIPFRLMRDDHIPDLHTTREGNALLALLRGGRRHVDSHRVILKHATLARWFRRRYKRDVCDLIDHPAQAALAQFILESEAVAPGCERVVSDLVEALYEFGSGSRSAFGANGPLMLLTAHRAKGLEFDHVLILDGEGWGDGSDDERRLFYVAMTRARKTLTLCEQIDGRHRFIRSCNDLVLRSRPDLIAMKERLDQRIWTATPEHVVLSWPGYFGPKAPIHRALHQLEYGDALTLRPRTDGKPGWEVADQSGVVVTRMAQRFSPPEGEIIEVRVAAIVVRKQQEHEAGQVRMPEWELVLPEIVYQRGT